jgi:[ribosomal protein S5]-alanine N-acetyltransferase
MYLRYMLTFSFSPFPYLHSERIYYRQLEETDYDAVYQLRYDPRVRRFISSEYEKSDEAVSQFIIDSKTKTNSADLVMWCMEEKTTQQVIGIIGYFRLYPEHHRAEIGYVLLHDQWGKGFATEAVKCISQYGFEYMHLHTIEARVSPLNIGSVRSLEKNNYQLEGLLKQSYRVGEEFTDTAVYSLFAHR